MRRSKGKGKEEGRDGIFGIWDLRRKRGDMKDERGERREDRGQRINLNFSDLYQIDLVIDFTWFQVFFSFF